MSLIILACIVVGIALIGIGIVRRSSCTVPPWQSSALIAAGLFLQSWWVAIFILSLIKTYIFREDT